MEIKKEKEIVFINLYLFKKARHSINYIDQCFEVFFEEKDIFVKNGLIE